VEDADAGNESRARRFVVDQHIILEEEKIAEERSAEAARLGNAIINQPIRRLTSLKAPVCIERGATAGEAIGLMTEHRIGCVLVIDGGRLVGVFTERDVLRKLAATGRRAVDTPVVEVMTPDPECLTLDDNIGFAMNLMSVGGFRHIPLVDSERRPTGVVAMRAIVDYIVDYFPNQVLNLPPAPQLSVPRQREGA
jgi:CBS domain-containing protein